jgi:hypothetical protein
METMFFGSLNGIAGVLVPLLNLGVQFPHSCADGLGAFESA